MSELDDHLLDRLHAGLEVVPSEPSAGEVAAIRDLVREHRRPIPGVAELHVGSRRSRGRRAALVAALAATLVVGSGAVAVATNGPFSGTARRAASALGLPVDSPELFNAKTALATLGGALAGHDDHQLADASREVSRRFAELSTDDARGIRSEAHRLLREADERLGAGHDRPDPQPGGDDRGGGGSSTHGRGPGPRGTVGDGGSTGDNGSGPNGAAHSGSGSDNQGPSTPTSSPQAGSGSGGSGSGDTRPQGGSGSGGDGGSVPGL